MTSMLIIQAVATVLCSSLLTRCAVAAQSSPRAAAKAVSLPLYADSSHLGYYANITVGTPPQNVRVSIDTGSADLWIFSNNVNCTPSTACQGSSFNPDDSSSFQSVAPGGFLVNYAGGNGAAGDFISETVQIGGATVNNVILGLATQAGSPNGLPIQGIMGLGMLFDEALRTENNTGYFNLPYRLAAEGLIDEAVFSIYLDDISSQTSSLLFGGIDTDKYTGELSVFDVTPENAGLVEYVLPVTSMSLVGSAGNTTAIDISGSGSNGGFPALLDTGSTAMSLPLDVVEQIYNQYPVAETNVGPVVNCDLANNGGSIAFQFGGSSGPTINVGLAEVVRHSPLIGNPDICFFDVYPEGRGSAEAVLGDSFLRAVYAVFDPGNGQIGLAQAKLNAANSNDEGLSASAPVPTGEAIVPLRQLGNGASFGGGIPGSAVGSAVVAMATVPASATAVQTPALLQSSAAVRTTLATGASAASVAASMPASGAASRAAGASTQATTAPTRSAAAPVESSTSTSAIPRFSGVAVGTSPPGLFSLLGALVGALAFA